MSESTKELLSEIDKLKKQRDDALAGVRTEQRRVPAPKAFRDAEWDAWDMSVTPRGCVCKAPYL